MSDTTDTTTLPIQSLLGRPVYDSNHRKLGRVYEFEAGRVGDDLCITALLVGPGSLLTRFGWTDREHGTRIPWEEIVSLSPHITVRPESAG